MLNHLNPNRDEREEVIQASVSTFKDRFYDPNLSGFDLDGRLGQQRSELMASEDFPKAMGDFFRTCKAHPIDFFYGPEKHLPLARLMKANFFTTGSGQCLFRDVLIGGRAEEAEIVPGDILLTVNGAPVDPQHLDVRINKPIHLRIESESGKTKAVELAPPSTWKRSKEKNLTCKDLGNGLGYLRIARWPGILGWDIARETTTAIKELNSKRLLIDLRGNTGSEGAGNLRLISYLTPKKIPVGYSLTRRRAQAGYNREELPRIERIPRLKLGVPIVLWRFRKVDKSIVVVSEGLGPKPFHGHITLLLNRHTISGAEIVAQFAKQHRIATIVGERTAGRGLSFASLHLPHDFRLTLPIGDYIPWHGNRFEDTGVDPDIKIPFTPGGKNIDHELEEAIKLSRG